MTSGIMFAVAICIILVAIVWLFSIPQDESRKGENPRSPLAARNYTNNNNSGSFVSAGGSSAGSSCSAGDGGGGGGSC
jgi:uncharacterized membrane protein YgcG